MIVVIWEFEVKPGKAREFEGHYSSDGTWAQFFRQDPTYHGTVLLRDSATPGRYLTQDMWNDPATYEAFKADNTNRYKELDVAFAELTIKETEIGRFEMML